MSNDLQIASDLHIEILSTETPNPLDYIKPSSKTLVLAGDIGSLYRYDQLKYFIEQIAIHFEFVLYVPGNHEYYSLKDYKHMSLKILNNRLDILESSISNLIVLNRSCIMLKDVCIIGCTLWSNPSIEIPKFIVQIPELTTNSYIDMYSNDLEYIETISQYCKEQSVKCIVVTHYGPTYDILKGSKRRKKFLSLYANNLDHLLSNDIIDTWICGHSHHNFDFISPNGTRVISNQKGKPKDKINDYKNNFII